MAPVNPWPMVRQFFETDDGSLPDIQLENLTNDQLVSIYETVIRLCSIVGEPTVWSKIDEKEIPLREVAKPANDCLSGRIEMFRHGLADLRIDGIRLQLLNICVEKGYISFDYSMGSEWNPQTVAALFEFLWRIQQKFPHARISQNDEGMHDTPNLEFSEAMLTYIASKTNQ